MFYPHGDLTITLLDAMPQEQLVAIADSRDESSRARVAARMALVRRYGCNDCGAVAGRECKPDYGCVNASRILRNDIFLGSFFNIARRDGDWTIWRVIDDEGNRQEITLSQGAMDDLADYFAEFYADDRGEARKEAATNAEP